MSYFRDQYIVQYQQPADGTIPSNPPPYSSAYNGEANSTGGVSQPSTNYSTSQGIILSPPNNQGFCTDEVVKQVPPKHTMVVISQLK